MTARLKTDSLPVSREVMIAKFKRELVEMGDYLSHFHDELLTDNRDVTIMYPRIMLNEAYQGVETATRYLDMLDEFVAKHGTSLTEVAEKAKPNAVG